MTKTLFERATHPNVITIPSSDTAFRQHVERVIGKSAIRDARQLQARLRRIFPRVVVRDRVISGEYPAWYVYRDGAWRPPADAPWWLESGVPLLNLGPNGFVVESNPAAASLLGLTTAETIEHHLTDFVPTGSLGDAVTLLEVVQAGHPLDATILLRPTTGEVIAVDVHVEKEGMALHAYVRLATGVELPDAIAPMPPPPMDVQPDRDHAFRKYAETVVGRMPEPTAEGLELRLRRLYPHAHVHDAGGRWMVSRDREATGDEVWWDDPTLPRVRYDSDALILEANDAAQRLLGRSLVGHHWQEFVTPGSSEQVSTMLAILAEVGAAESRFRMPGGDGSLIEFDSYTQVDGETLTTTMRRRVSTRSS